MVNTHCLGLLRDEKKRNLIIFSETFKKQHKRLYTFIRENEDITEELIQRKLTVEDIRTINDLLPILIKTCQDEWQGDEIPAEILEADERIPCSLCNTSTRQIFYITNKFSGRKLNVGSTCISEFAMESLKDGKTISQIVKEANRNLQLKHLNNQYPGIEKVVSGWNDEIHKYEVLIPTHIEEPYLNLGQDIHNKYNDFLDKKQILIEEFAPLLTAQRELKQQMHQYANQHKDKKFVASRLIVNWLQRQNDTDTIEKLKVTGYIDHLTIHRIGESRFVQSVIPDLNEQMTSFNAQITDLQDENLIVTIPLDNVDITLTYSVTKFLEHFAHTLFGVQRTIAFNKVNVLRLGKVKDDLSKLIVLHRLSERLLNIGYRLVFEEEISEREERQGKVPYDYMGNDVIDLYAVTTQKAVTLPLSAFVDEFKPLVFNEGRHTIEDIVAYYNHPTNKKRTKEEIEGIRKSTQRMRL